METELVCKGNEILGNDIFHGIKKNTYFLIHHTYHINAKMTYLQVATFKLCY